MNPSKTVFRAPQEGEVLKALGFDFRIRVSGPDTGGAWFAFEFDLPPRGEVPPHVHRNEEEVLFVVDGEIDSRVGDDVVKARAGSCHVIPRGTVHAQANTGTKPARLLLVFSPPRIEGLLRDASRAPQDQFPQIAAKYGMELVA